MPKRYWWIILTYILCQISGFLVATPLLNFLPKSQRFGAWTTFSFIACLIIILILLLPERHMASRWRQTGFGATILWSFLGIILVYLAEIVTGIIDQAVFGAPNTSENTQEIMNLARISPYVIVAIVIIGPMLEEIIFRKIIFGALEKRFHFWIAAIASAFLFAIAHHDGHLIIYGSIGLVLAFIYYKTGRIIVSMIAHASMNAIAVIVTLSPAIQKMLEEEQQRQHLSFIKWLFM
ncbi:CPBP family intramembrane glutamic endopeptidase [Camelliibacillus cellulosilyticus]|uniref:CPBP family intramembrane glutamic endopeptidase n=1 Tax=Camelliibacillus cellulosilyticus TaxID=2174486 RepID=A0ABV9GRF8_9BACL